MEPSINLSELLLAMEQASAVQPNAGFTTRELMVSSGYGEKRCKHLIRAGLSTGQLTVGRKHMTDMVGRPQTVPCYVPVSKRKSK
jgi:hypothetical protein